MKNIKTKVNNLKSVRLKWYNTDKEIQKKYRNMIINTMRSMKDLNHPSQLLTHTIFLGKDYFGPSIHVYGKKNNDYFHCQYYEETEWSSICETS